MLIRSIVGFALLALLLFASPVKASNHALLIGASNYRFEEIPKLQAPKNDVALVWDLLRERGFSADDIVVLSDEIDPDHKEPIPHQMPTAKKILQELDALAARAKQGDLIVVYYSGHGSVIRQRAPRPGETIEQSGFNQVLLAIDAQKADPVKAEIPGGILDKDLKAKFDALKEKAFLWLILDACHAEGLTRDPHVDAAIHFVPPHVLGLEDTPIQPSTSENRWIGGGLGGRQVAFLAAPENSPAFEKPISDLENKHYSLFTQTLVRLLRAENFGSYRSLGEALLAMEAALPGNVPVPVIEGDLDQPLFAGTVAGAHIWDAHYDQTSGGVSIDAGSLQGIAGGTILSLEAPQGLIGFASVETVSIASSFARPIDYHGRPAPSADSLKEKLTAKVVTSTIELGLKVSVPPEEDIDGGEVSRTGLRGIMSLTQDRQSPLPIRWVQAGRNADIHLRVVGERIYLVSATGELATEGRSRTPSIAILQSSVAVAENLKDNLWQVLRQLNLRRVAEMVQGNDLSKAISVRLSLVRDQKELDLVSKDETQACKSWIKNAYSMPSAAFEVGTQSAARLTHCDRITIEITNKWPKAVDVTLLYLDSQGGINPLGEGDQPRVQPISAASPFPPKFEPISIVTWCGAAWDICRRLETTGYQPIGRESLMIIITEAGNTKHTFNYLAQKRLSNAVSERGLVQRAGIPLEDLLIDAGLYPAQGRRSVDKSVPGTIKLFTWNVVPPGEFANR